MTEPYTPTTDEVRDAFADVGDTEEDIDPAFLARFDRWLAAHDKEVLEKAAERVKDAKHRMSLKLHEHWDDTLPEDECDCCAAEVVTIAVAAVRGEGGGSE